MIRFRYAKKTNNETAEMEGQTEWAETIARHSGEVVEVIEDTAPRMHGSGSETSPEIAEAVRQPREIKLNACWCRTCFSGQTNHSFDEYALY